MKPAPPVTSARFMSRARVHEAIRQRAALFSHVKRQKRALITRCVGSPCAQATRLPLDHAPRLPCYGSGARVACKSTKCGVRLLPTELATPRAKWLVDRGPSTTFHALG